MSAGPPRRHPPPEPPRPRRPALRRRRPEPGGRRAGGAHGSAPRRRGGCGGALGHSGAARVRARNAPASRMGGRRPVGGSGCRPRGGPGGASREAAGLAPRRAAPVHRGGPSAVGRGASAGCAGEAHRAARAGVPGADFRAAGDPGTAAGTFRGWAGDGAGDGARPRFPFAPCSPGAMCSITSPLGGDWKAAPGQRLLADATREARYPHPVPLPEGEGMLGRLGILGTSIVHSRSPRIHRQPFDRIDIPEDAPVESLVDALLPHYRGFAVTSPFKIRLARHTGSPLDAINTLVRRRDRWESFNTDTDGARTVLERLGARDVLRARGRRRQCRHPRRGAPRPAASSASSRRAEISGPLSGVRHLDLARSHHAARRPAFRGRPRRRHRLRSPRPPHRHGNHPPRGDAAAPRRGLVHRPGPTAARPLGDRYMNTLRHPLPPHHLRREPRPRARLHHRWLPRRAFRSSVSRSRPRSTAAAPASPRSPPRAPSRIRWRSSPGSSRARRSARPSRPSCATPTSAPGTTRSSSPRIVPATPMPSGASASSTGITAAVGAPAAARRSAASSAAPSPRRTSPRPSPS